MIDPFVALTPILVLAVMALLRFVGCAQIFGIQGSETITLVTFKNTTPGQPLNGLYQGLDFGSNKWFWDDSGRDSIYLGPSGSSGLAFARITFPAPSEPHGQVLFKIEAYCLMAGTLQVDDLVNPPLNQPLDPASPPVEITTGWTRAASFVEVSSTVGSKIGIISLSYG